MKWSINSIFDQNLNSKTFYYKNDQNGKTIFFIHLKK